MIEQECGLTPHQHSCLLVEGRPEDRHAPVASAGATLRSLVGLVADMSDEPQGLELGEVATATAGSPDLELPIEDLDLSERPRNCLKRAQVNSVGELLLKTEDDLLAITNFGQKSLDEVIQKLDERGLQLRTKD
jgi:DNA-directed RNA polymerase subunit alpha